MKDFMAITLSYIHHTARMIFRDEDTKNLIHDDIVPTEIQAYENVAYGYIYKVLKSTGTQQ